MNIRLIAITTLLVIAAIPPVSLKAQKLPTGYFHMVTKFQEGKKVYLESNAVADGNWAKGATFLADRSPDSTGQQWKLSPAGGGFYHLTSAAMERKGHRLEGGNGSANLAGVGGAAHMAASQQVTGQLWKVIPAGGGYFALTTQWVEGDNLYLEGGMVNATRKPGQDNGDPAFAARMTKRHPNGSFFAGQLWKLLPVAR